MDVILNHNLDGRLLKDALSQQLRHYLGLMRNIKCTIDTKGREDKTIRQQTSTDMMVDQAQ